MKIFAITLDGNKLALEAAKKEKVSDIKNKIQEKTGLSPDEQILMYKEGILEDDKTVDDCQIADQSAILVILRQMQITVLTMDGKNVPFKVSKGDKVSDIKKKIEEKTGLSADEQKFVYKEGILEDDKTVDECQIEDKSVIVVKRKRCKMQIFVVTSDGKSVAFKVAKEYKIKYIKKKIQEKMGLSLDEQKLMYKGGILEDDKTVDECQIEDKSAILVILRQMKIFVKTLDGKLVELIVNEGDTVMEVKKKIQKKTGLFPDEQKLVYQGGILEDNETVDKCQIADQSVIKMRLRKIQIFAITSDNKSVTFKIAKEAKVSDIKKKIQEKMGLSLDEQKLVYHGDILEDNKTVDECQIVYKSVINVMIHGEIQIIVKTKKGESVALEVTKKDKVSDIKKKFQVKTGLSLKELKIVNQSCALEDDKTVEECQIVDKSEIIYSVTTSSKCTLQ